MRFTHGEGIYYCACAKGIRRDKEAVMGGRSSTQGCSEADVNRQPGNPKISRLASRQIGSVQLMSVVGILTSHSKKSGIRNFQS